MPLFRSTRTVAAVVLVAGAVVAGGAFSVGPFRAASAVAQVQATPAPATGGDTRLEDAADKAGDTARRVAVSLLGLGLAIAAVILLLKRDFKEAGVVFGIGFLAVVFATPTGLSVLSDLAETLFGAR
jgi:hypothetical protein